MQGTSLLGKHMGINVFIFMRGSCAGGWPNNMDLSHDAAWDREAKLYNDLPYPRMPNDIGPQSHDVSWYGGV